MGYSRSTSTVRKYWAYLSAFASRPPSVTWVETSPEAAAKLAYKLRECRTIVRRNPDEFLGLRETLDLYTISSKGSTVLAAQAEARAIGAEPASFSGSGFQRASSVAEVIQGWLNAQPCDSFSIASVLLSDEERVEIEIWASNLEWTLEWTMLGLSLRKGVSL